MDAHGSSARARTATVSQDRPIPSLSSAGGPSAAITTCWLLAAPWVRRPVDLNKGIERERASCEFVGWKGPKSGAWAGWLIRPLEGLSDGSLGHMSLLASHATHCDRPAAARQPHPIPLDPSGHESALGMALRRWWFALGPLNPCTKVSKGGPPPSMTFVRQLAPVCWKVQLAIVCAWGRAHTGGGCRHIHTGRRDRCIAAIDTSPSRSASKLPNSQSAV